MVKWSERALNNLLEMSRVIESNFSNALADKILDDLVDYVETAILKNKAIGQIFQLNTKYRFIVFKGNKIFYRLSDANEDVFIIYVHARYSKLEELDESDRESK